MAFLLSSLPSFLPSAKKVSNFFCNGTITLIEEAKVNKEVFMISGGWSGPKDTTCTPRVEVKSLFEQWAQSPGVKKKEGDQWTAYEDTFRLMDGINYTLQVLRNSRGVIHVAKLFNDRGIELGNITPSIWACGYTKTFQRSVDVLLMTQALEMAAGQIVSL